MCILGIYHLYFDKKEKHPSIHISEWPKFSKELTDKKAEHAGDIAVEIIAAVRKFKAENNMPLNTELKELIIETKDSKELRPFLDDLKATTRASDIKFEGKADIEINPELKIRIISS